MDYLQWVLLALELLFLLRFVLKLIGADPYNPFAQAPYKFTGFFLYPFLVQEARATSHPHPSGRP